MFTGILKKLANLSQQVVVPNKPLVPGLNDQRYGFIEGTYRHDVYFCQLAVARRYDVNDFRQRQQVEYTIETLPYHLADTGTSSTPPRAQRNLLLHGDNSAGDIAVL